MKGIDRLHIGARMSKIVRHAGTVYLCGQTANGGPAAEADVRTQTHEVLSRIDGLLAEAGSDRSRLLTVLIHLRDITDFAAMNEVWESWIVPGTAPARTTVQGHLASDSLLVEMTVTAALN